MPSPTRPITRELTAELRYQYFSRGLLVVALLMASGSLVAFTGSMSSARSTHEHFVRQVAVFEANGISLRDALAAPLTVVREGNEETIDNPLKYDYLEVGKAIHAVDGIGPVIGTALDLVTFIVIPLTFLVYGAHGATFDRRARTMALRASRDSWRQITAAKLLSIVATAAVATASVVVSASAISVVAGHQVRQLTDGIDYALSTPASSAAPLAAKLLMTVGVAVFFGIVGHAVGAATGSTSWPMVLAAAALFLLPFVSPWDPRNLLAVIGAEVYDFWGQFRMRPPLAVALPVAAATLAAYLAAAVAASLLLPRPAKRFG